MSFTDVIAQSSAARGANLPSTTPIDLVSAFLDEVRPIVLESADGRGCAVAAVTVVSADQDSGLREVAASAFSSWTSQLAKSLAIGGLSPEQAADLANLLINLLEGAHVLCRAAGSIAPFDSAARAMLALVPKAASS